jgi:hypothetical protein
MPAKDSMGNIAQGGPYYKYDSASGKMVLDPTANPVASFEAGGSTYDNWVQNPDGTFGPAVLNPGLQSDPASALSYDPAKGLMSTTSEGKKIWISPEAAGGSVGSTGGGPMGSQSGGLIHEGAQWNDETGTWDHPINWGNIMSMGIGGAIAAPFVVGALAGAGGAGAAGGGAEAGADIGAGVGAETGAGVGLGETAATTGLVTGAGLPGAVAAPTLADVGAGGLLASTPSVTAGTLPVGAPSGAVPAAFSPTSSIGSTLGQKAITQGEQSGVKAGVDTAEGKTPGQTLEDVAIGAGTGVVGSEIGGAVDASPLEQTLINQGVKSGVGVGVNALANNTTAGSQAYDSGGNPIPGATYDANGNAVDANGNQISTTPGYDIYGNPTTSMPGSTPSTLGSTLSSISSPLSSLGGALAAGASAAGNVQRANIDTNVAAQSAYNQDLMSRGALEDTQRTGEAKDVARQSFLSNFTGGPNVPAGGLTPMSPLEQQTLANLATQGATALAKPPSYSAANMTPLTNYTGAANNTGVSTTGNALTTAGPLLNVAGQLVSPLATLGRKLAGGGGGGNTSSDNGGAGSPGPVLDGNGNVVGQVDASGNFTAATIPDPGVLDTGVPVDLSGDF